MSRKIAIYMEEKKPESECYLPEMDFRRAFIRQFSKIKEVKVI